MKKLSEVSCQPGIIRALQEKTQRNIFATLQWKVISLASMQCCKIPHDIRSVLKNGTNLQPGLAVASPEARENSFLSK